MINTSTFNAFSASSAPDRWVSQDSTRLPMAHTFARRISELLAEGPPIHQPYPKHQLRHQDQPLSMVNKLLTM
ncbi:hypothetical protein ANCCAN_27089 [Ancylostoma caninum]|uniref:Uncharacterized protein n=1 Tax=Ancylostoma caninum TaxID=29170 RepID=A0A368F6G0_ANCCA|nr:hypothetical protein ANCCAN_27089 [Ancylostoma caninum]